jgi:hypothetical protein
MISLIAHRQTLILFRSNKHNSSIQRIGSLKGEIPLQDLNRPHNTPSLEMTYEHITNNHQNIAIFLSVCRGWNLWISYGETRSTSMA